MKKIILCLLFFCFSCTPSIIDVYDKKTPVSSTPKTTVTSPTPTPSPTPVDVSNPPEPDIAPPSFK